MARSANSTGFSVRWTDPGAVEQVVHVFGLAGIGTEETMLAEHDQFARFGRGLVGRCRHGIGIVQSEGRPGLHEPAQFFG